MMHWRISLPIGAAIVVLAILGAVFVGHKSAPATVTKQLAHLRLIGQALQLHANSHEGRLPPEWMDIFQDFPNREPQRLYFSIPGQIQPTPWIYHGSSRQIAEVRPDEIILESPPFPQGRALFRCVLYGNLTVDLVRVKGK